MSTRSFDVPGGVVLNVAVPSPLRKLFDYLPMKGAPLPLPGARVRVPFGRSHKVAMVVAQGSTSSVEPKRLRSISNIIDERPLFDESLMMLMRFAIDYFHHAPGDVLATMLPAWLREGRAARTRTQQRWTLSDLGRAAIAQDSKLGAVQRTVLQRLHQEHALFDVDSGHRDALRRLRNRGLVICEEVSASDVRVAAREPATDGSGDPAQAQDQRESKLVPVPMLVGPTPNRYQQAAIDEISAQLDGFVAWLLDGVTGSGKTEVYLALIAQVLAADKQALVLIPEIGLTPQIVQRFQSRLNVPVAVLHSAMAEGERRDAWTAARDGTASVVVGTRSAIFTPLARPGIVIVDEEHDLSYKQQDGLRYSARDLAVLRARHAQIPVVLGSASPSLESLHNVSQQRYRY